MASQYPPVIIPWTNYTYDDSLPSYHAHKHRRKYYIRLASESSKASDEDIESICSVQGNETAYVTDTSDTVSYISDEIDTEFDCEYEVASMSESNLDISTSTSEETDVNFLVAAAAVICDSSLEITDIEDEDSLDAFTAKQSKFFSCVKCNGQNLNPLYSYCDKCFQDRKKLFPPRPRGTKKRTPHLSSQDSGLGSTQEVIPSDAASPGMSKIDDNSSTTSTFTFDLEDNSLTNLENRPNLKRSYSSDSLLDCEVKKRKLSSVSLEQPSCSFASTITLETTTDIISASSSEQSKLLPAEPSPSISQSELSVADDDDDDGGLCIFCNDAPKNCIFIHPNLAHRCCCYKCGKRTLKVHKKCPICNRTVNKVVKLYTC